MERIFGGILAILMFCAIIWMGWLRGLPTEEVVQRAGLCGLAGGLIGWLSFGPLAKALAQSTVRITEERPPHPAEAAPPEKKAAP